MLQIYDGPYKEDPASSTAVYKTMQALDWKALLKKVDRAYCDWHVPSAILYGNSVRSLLLLITCRIARARAIPVHCLLYLLRLPATWTQPLVMPRA